MKINKKSSTPPKVTSFIPNIDYGKMMSVGLERIVKDILNQIKKAQDENSDDLNKKTLSNSILFIVRVDRDDIIIPKTLLKYAKEKEIKTFSFVLDKWFKNLIINEDNFSVELLFGDSLWEKLVIPYSSLMTVSDEDNQFELKLNPYTQDLKGLNNE